MESGAGRARGLAGRAIAAAEAKARLAISRSLLRSLDATPREKRGHAREIVCLDPEQQALAVARINWERRDGVDGREGFQRRFNEVKQRLSHEVRSTEQEVIANRISATNGASTRSTRNEGLLGKRKEARDLALLGPEEMVRRVFGRNKAGRTAIRAGQRQRRRAADEARANKKLMKRAREIFEEGMAARSSDGLDSAEAGQDALRVRRAGVRALLGLDSPRLAREVARMSRARRFAILLDQRERKRKRAADEASVAGKKKPQVDREAVMGDADASGGLNSAEARQKIAVDGAGTFGIPNSAESRQGERPAPREHAASRALAETDHPQENKQEAPWRDGEVHVENALKAEGTGGLGSAVAERGELPSNGEHANARALAEMDHPLEIKLETPWRDEEVRVEKLFMDSVGIGDLDSAEAGQGGLPLSGEHVHAFALAETDHPPESEEVGEWMNREVGINKALVGGVGTGAVGRNAAIMEGVGAGGVSFDEPRLENLPAKAFAEVVSRATMNAVVHSSGRVLVDGVRTGDVGRNAVMDGAGAGGFVLPEAKLAELRAKAVAEVAERVVRDGELKARGEALVDGASSGEVNRNGAVVEGTGSRGFAFMEARLEHVGAKAVAEVVGRGAGNAEVQRIVRALAECVGPDKVDISSAVVGGTGARGFPLVAANIAEFRTEAVDEVTGRTTWDAAGVHRDAGHARDQHAEELPTCGQEAFMDGIGTGRMDGSAAAVDFTGAGGFPFLEPEHEELGTEAVAEIAERVARDAAEVQGKADLAQARQVETLQTGGQSHMGGIGTSEMGRKTAVVDDAGTGEFPFLEARLEEILTGAIELVGGSDRSEKDAVTDERGGVSALEDDVRREVHAEAVSRLEEDIRAIDSFRQELGADKHM